MKKNFKRWLALLLAVAMVATSVVYSTGTSLKATGDDIVGQTEAEPDASSEGTGTVTADEGTDETQPEENTQEIELPDRTSETSQETPQDNTGVTQVPADNSAAGNDAESADAGQGEKTEQKYTVIFHKPAVEGGVLKVWADENEKKDITYDSEDKYTEEITEGTLLNFEVTANEKYEIEKVTDQKGVEIAPKEVNEKVYTYQVTGSENIEIHILYKEASPEKEPEVKNDEQAIGDELKEKNTPKIEEKDKTEEKNAKEDDKDKSRDSEVAIKPQKSLSEIVDGTIVTVESPEGVLEEGWTLSVKAISGNQAEGAIENAIENAIGDDKEIADMKAFDITIIGKNGNKIQPDGSVNVTFSNADVEGEVLEVYHVDNSKNNAEQVSLTTIGSTVGFEAEHFSIYVLVGIPIYTNTEEDAYTMTVGEKITLTSSDKYAGEEWSTDDTDTVKLKDNKQQTVEVEALKAGSARILSGDKEEFYINVVEKSNIEKIEISGSSHEMSTLDKPMQLTATTTPAGEKVTWKSSDTSVATVNEKGLVTAKGGGSSKITASSGSIVSDEYEITVKQQYKITFNLNGGQGVNPSPIIASAGSEVTIPEGNDFTAKNKKVFVGWSLNKDANKDSQYERNDGTIYAPGSSEFIMPSKNVTLYATWSSQNVNAQFFIRLDGSIPTEPQGHESSKYTAAIDINDAIKVATFYTNSTLPGVYDRLNSVPTDEQIKKVKSDYNPDTQYVLWYVIKSEATWHVDGVLLEISKINLSYNANAPEGTWSNMPDGKQYSKGKAAIVSDKVPTRTGYTFTGWNTQADGKGVSYSSNESFIINEATTLYAQWEPNGNTLYRVKYYYEQSGKYLNEATSIDKRYGKTDDDVEVTAQDKIPTKKGYVYDSKASNVLSGKVNANGTLVLKVYFKQQFSVAYDPGTHGIFTQQVFDKLGFGDDRPEFKGDTSGQEGYVFAGWEPKLEEKVTADVVYVAQWQRDFTGISVTPYKGIYDGQEHSVSIEGIKDSDIIEYSSDGNTWSTEPVEYKNVIKNENKEVSEYPVYIRVKNGTQTSEVIKSSITITPRQLLIASASGEKEYDGTPLTKNDPSKHISITEQGFVEGEGASYAITGSQLDAGNSKNTFSYELNDNTLADNYEIRTQEGTLEVRTKAAPITITAGSSNKQYDGKPFTYDNYTFDSTILAAGDVLTATVKGSITNAGTAKNVVASYKVERGGQDVTKNYTFNESIEGILTVTERNVIIESASASKVYDGTPLTRNNSSTDIKISGDGFVKGEGASYDITGTQTEAKTGKNTFTYTLNEGTNEKNYVITKREGMLEVNKRNITIKGMDASQTYNGKPLTAGYELSKKTPLAAGQKIKQADVAGSQLIPGRSDNVVSNAVIVIKDTDKEVTDNYYITYKKGLLIVDKNPNEIIITASSDSREYNGTPLTNSGYTFTQGVLAEGDVLSATVEGNITDAGKVDNIVTGFKVMHGAQDVTNHYTFGKSVNGTLEVTKKEVTITSQGGTQVYNGRELTNDTVESQGFIKGEGAAYEVTGSQLDAGESDNTFSYSFNQGTKAENYEIKIILGKLKVTPITTQIIVTAKDGNQVYDGTPLTNPEYTYTENVLITGDVLTATVAGTITDAGKADNTVTGYKVMRDKQDITKNYTFGNPVKGTLEVIPRRITLISATDTKEYDGTVLTNSQVEVGGMGFAEGESATYDVTGSQLDVGESKNTFAYELNESVKADNYEITQVEGTLKVTPNTTIITIEAASDSKAYDGNALVNAGYTYTDNVLVKGDILEAVIEGSIINVGNTKNVVKEYKVMRGATNVTENYTFGNPVAGILEITQRPVTITAASAEKSYDGTALIKAASIASVGGILPLHTYTATVEGSQTYVGSSANVVKDVKISTILGNEDVTANYDITYVDGTLTVKDDKVNSDDVVTKTHDETKSYNVGDTVTFNITVKNIYDENKTITITEQNGVTITGKSTFANVAPGEVVKTTAEYTVTEEDVLKGTFTNTVSAKFSGEEKTYEKEDTVDRFVKPNGHLTITKDTAKDAANGLAYVLGEIIEYQVKVTNDGNLTLTDVVVTDKLTGDTWNAGTLLPGDSKEYSAYYKVTQEDVLKGEVLNQATATGTSPDTDKPKPEVTPGEKVVPTVGPEGHLTVTKETTSIPKNGIAYTLGEEISYKIIAANDGNLTLTDVVVTDKLTGDEWQVGTLEPGQSSEAFTAIHKVAQKDILNGTVVNEATATGISPDPEKKEPEVTPGETVDQTEEANGHLTIAKTTTSTPENGAAYTLGEEITYEIVATNDGNLTLTDVVVTDALTGDKWEIESLKPGESSKVFTANYEVTEQDILNGTVVNEAAATGTSPDPEQPEPEVKPGTEVDPTETPQSSLFVEKIAAASPNGTYNIGDTIPYTIRVVNNGNVTVKGITVTDDLTNGQWAIDSLEPGGTQTFTTNHVVTEADVLAGQVVNVATAGGTAPDGSSVTNQDTETTEIEESTSHLSIVKETTSTPANGDAYVLGETITYNIVATNDGNLTLTNVVVTDELTGDDWTIESLAPGQSSEVFTTSYTVTSADIQNGSVLNVATAYGDTPDPENPVPGVEPGEEEVQTEDPNPNVTVEKTVTNAPENGTAYVLGEAIEYRVTVSNQGNVPVENIKVEDSLVSLADSIITSLAPGESRDFNYSYEVTDTDIRAGQVVNSATASTVNPDGPKDEAEIITPTETENPNYTVNKTVVNPQAEYRVGDIIQYQIEVSNTGNVTLNNVAVNDNLQGAAGTATFTNVGNNTVDGNRVIINSMAPGETVILNCEYQLVREDAGAEVSNIASVTTDETGETPREDETEVTPVVSIYALLIHYVDTAGSTVAPDYVEELEAGAAFAVTSPTIDGYTPEYASISSDANGMPARDLEFTVTYTANPIVTPIVPPTPDTPVTPTPVTPTIPVAPVTPVTPAAAAPAAVTPAAAPPAAAPTVIVPPTPTPAAAIDAVVTENEDGDYDLTSIQDTETPLANKNLDDHVCCILHFLLMLLALIVLAFYTRSMKKRQARIFELREELSIEMARRGLDEEEKEDSAE